MAIDKIYLIPLSGAPSEYDNSISYLEFLGKINAKLTEVINTINNIQTDWDLKIDVKISAYSQIVNAQLEELKVFTESQNALIKNEMVNIINAQIASIQAQIDLQTESFININNQLVGLNNLISSTKDYIIQYVNLQNAIQDNNSAIEYGKIYAAINEIIASYPPIYNPTTGLYEPLNIVVQDMYDVLRYNAITALEFDSLLLTAQEFDNFNITARDFDVNAKVLLGYLNSNFEMINPYTGITQLIKDVVIDIVARTNNGRFKASEYNDFYEFVLSVNKADNVKAMLVK